MYKALVKAADYLKKKVCFKKLVMQPHPMVLFTWDGWNQDMPCTFKGPSSLFQRWNLQIRDAYSLPSPISRDKAVILVLIRKGRMGDGSISTVRYIANSMEVVNGLSGIDGAAVTAADLADYSFDEQLQLVQTTSILIGMHGAGITHSIHMAIGTPLCCGVVEMFPQGEYSVIRGHGNMARRMGVVYERIDISASMVSHGIGTRVPVDELVGVVKEMINRLHRAPSCVHPSAIDDPHFSAKYVDIWQ